MNKSEKERINEKIENLEDKISLKVDNIQSETKGEIANIRVILEEKVLPILEATHDQAKKTNGRVNKLEAKNDKDDALFSEFKKKVDSSLKELSLETEIPRFFARHPKILLFGMVTSYILLYIGIVFDEQVRDFIINIF